MEKDAVDAILGQWMAERPELDTAALGIVIRIMSLNKSFFKQATRALEPLELELWEYDVLSSLRRQGKPCALPATRLARESELSSGAMTNRIDRLEERGLVRREAGKTDRRRVMVYLTGDGRRVIDAAIRFRLDAAREQLQTLNVAERRQLAALLRKVVLAVREAD
jgi:DNA-binding MarR family transcriptional regulator